MPLEEEIDDVVMAKFRQDTIEELTDTVAAFHKACLEKSIPPALAGRLSCMWFDYVLTVSSAEN